jgi:hypothetical protein
MLHPAFDLNAYRYGEHGEPVQIVGGAIERVDNPDRIGFALLAALFGKDGVVGVVFENAVNHGLFGCVIGITDVIVVALFLNLELAQIDHFLYERATGASCRHHRYIE